MVGDFTQTLSVPTSLPKIRNRPRKAAAVNDQLDVTIHDTEVLDEIEMMTNLIIATSESDGPLTQGRIDGILGVDPGSSAR